MKIVLEGKELEISLEDYSKWESDYFCYGRAILNVVDGKATYIKLDDFHTEKYMKNMRAFKNDKR